MIAATTFDERPVLTSISEVSADNKTRRTASSSGAFTLSASDWGI